jgi:hypothetical protein
VKHTRILAALLGIVTLLTTSCGVSDKIASVSMTAVGITGSGVINLQGLGSTIQLHVTANYTSGKQIDQTNFVTYTVTPEGIDDTGALLPSPPQTLDINKTGMIFSVKPAVCVWKNVGTTQTPSWFYQGDYKIVATYRGFTSNPVFVPIASSDDTIAGQVGQCGPA